MEVPNDMRKELLRALNHKDNKTGFSHIPIGNFRDKTGIYVFAILCQKRRESPKTEKRRKNHDI